MVNDKDIKIKEMRYVNVLNEFTFLGNIYVIDKSVEEYKVINSFLDNEDYTNKSIMDKVLVILTYENNLIFYNQNDEIIDNKFIKLKGENNELFKISR